MSNMRILETFIVLTIAGCTLGQCPHSWIHRLDFCYLFSTDALNWTFAMDACIVKGGYLAEPKEIMASYYLELASDRMNTDYWIGGKNRIIDGQWIWVYSNETLRDTYTELHPDEYNQGGNDDCLFINHTHYQWKTTRCDLENHYICQRKALELYVQGECGNSWGQHGDVCYFFSTESDVLNQTSAQNACTNMGGYLAEPKTKSDYDFLKAVAGLHSYNTRCVKGCWLGGENRWTWMHSNELLTNTYTEWNPGEPANDHMKICLGLNRDTYNLLHLGATECEILLNYICEKKLTVNSLGPAVPNSFG